MSKQQYKCYYCHCQFKFNNPLGQYYPTIDHVIPLLHGGYITNPINVVIACRQCNERKRNKVACSDIATRKIYFIELPQQLRCNGGTIT